MARKRRRTSGSRSPLPRDELCPSLDLHGETAESARRIAELWLREQQSDAVPLVRVITGRGRRSLGPPVLPGEIEDLLTQLRGSVVAQFAIESSGGAFRVELRKPPRVRLAPPAGSVRPLGSLPSASTHDNAPLRRQAEEALAELGIAPTPELIRAEMRRIREQGGRK